MATTHSGINVAACLVLTASALAFVTVPIAGGRQEASDQKKPASIDVPAGDSSTLVYWNVLASGPLSIPITDNATITHTLDGNLDPLTRLHHVISIAKYMDAAPAAPGKPTAAPPAKPAAAAPSATERK